MNQGQRAELAALADYFFDRREFILSAWRSTVENDPKLGTASVLSRRQFNDHIPSVLSAFERELRADGIEEDEAKQEHKECAAEHGLHRWHHGYNQEEVMREWGHLHVCLLNELENYADTHASPDRGILRRARLELAQLCNMGVIESAVKYSRLQQIEAASRLRDLERAQAHLQAIERERAEGWREAAHDLRNKVGDVHNLAEILTSEPEQVRAEYLTMLQESVASLRELLGDLTILSRLEAGHERRNLRQFDAAATIRKLCAAMRPMADERGLSLTMEGPGTLWVHGDVVKIERIAQNLILNAVRYTERGGVKVTCNTTDTGGVEQWELCVQDTGPGFRYGPATPLTGALKTATDEALIVEEPSEDSQPAPTLPSESVRRPADQEVGEGIGLVIVKRLCELLDASLELQTEIGKGSTFRVIFPLRYDHP